MAQTFTVRTSEQLPAFVQAFRRQAGLTQAQVAQRLGVTQQTYSMLERRAASMSAARLLKLLHILGAELVLAQQSTDPEEPGASNPADW